MVHSGYEASAVNATFSSLGGFLATVKGNLFSSYKDELRCGFWMSRKPRNPLMQIRPPRVS